jgi:hypothetical protein
VQIQAESSNPSRTKWHRRRDSQDYAATDSGQNVSRYKNVYALLLYWQDNDLEVEREIENLEDLLKTDFNFQVEQWRIPYSSDARFQLTDRLNAVSRSYGPDDLVILYYGGHGRNQKGKCIWFPRADSSDKYDLEWNSIAPLLSKEPFDVLYILDCCFASAAASAFAGASTRGANWLLASCGTNVTAKGVSRLDFTSRMTCVLGDTAHMIQDEQCVVQSFSSEDLHTNLHLDHWNQLDTNAVHIRLNREACRGIDLVPLPSFDDQTSVDDDDFLDEERPAPWSSKKSCYMEEILSSSRPHHGDEEIDIVLVPGGNGDPYRSFTADRCMWPSDVLAPELEDRGFWVRILPFGFQWGSSRYSVSEFERCSRSLVTELRKVRQDHSPRPILFIGYGRGCTVVRNVIQDLYGSSCQSC